MDFELQKRVSLRVSWRMIVTVKFCCHGSGCCFSHFLAKVWSLSFSLSLCQAVSFVPGVCNAVCPPSSIPVYTSCTFFFSLGGFLLRLPACLAVLGSGPFWQTATSLADSFPCRRLHEEFGLTIWTTAGKKQLFAWRMVMKLNYARF